MASSFSLLKRNDSSNEPVLTDSSLPLKKVAKMMGQRVLVTRVYRRTEIVSSGLSGRGDITKQWQVRPVLPEDYRSGWVVGTTWLQNGHVVYFLPEDGGNEWREDSRVQCLLVSYWPNRKPVKVPLDGFVLQAHDEEPFPHADTYKWTERDRQMLRNGMASAPRDEKGRLVSLYDACRRNG